LKEEAAGRVQIERTIHQDMRGKSRSLKEAAEQSPTVIMDLDLDGHIRWVSPSWQKVIGIDPDSVRGKRIADLLVGNQTAFTKRIEWMKRDDSRSQVIRFQMYIDPGSVLHLGRSTGNCEKGVPADEKCEDEEQIFNLEAQGIIVCDRTSGGESHLSTPYSHSKL
jgi:serine/threonine-protein kinase RIM15